MSFDINFNDSTYWNPDSTKLFIFGKLPNLDKIFVCYKQSSLTWLWFIYLQIFFFFPNRFDGVRAGAEKMPQIVYEPMTNKKATVWIYSVTASAQAAFFPRSKSGRKIKILRFNIERKKLFSSTFSQTTCMVAPKLKLNTSGTLRGSH